MAPSTGTSVEAGGDRRGDRVGPRPAPDGAGTRMRAAAYADGHRSARHRDDPASGCTFSSLVRRGRSWVDRSSARHDRVRRAVRSIVSAPKRRGALRTKSAERRLRHGRGWSARWRSPASSTTTSCRRKSSPRRARRCRSPKASGVRSDMTAPLPGAGLMFPRPFSSSGKPGDPRRRFRLPYASRPETEENQVGRDHTSSQSDPPPSAQPASRAAPSRNRRQGANAVGDRRAQSRKAVAVEGREVGVEVVDCEPQPQRRVHSAMVLRAEHDISPDRVAWRVEYRPRLTSI